MRMEQPHLLRRRLRYGGCLREYVGAGADREKDQYDFFGPVNFGKVRRVPDKHVRLNSDVTGEFIRLGESPPR